MIIVNESFLTHNHCLLIDYCRVYITNRYQFGYLLKSYLGDVIGSVFFTTILCIVLWQFALYLNFLKLILVRTSIFLVTSFKYWFVFKFSSHYYLKGYWFAHPKYTFCNLYVSYLCTDVCVAFVLFVSKYKFRIHVHFVLESQVLPAGPYFT